MAEVKGAITALNRCEAREGTLLVATSSYEGEMLVQEFAPRKTVYEPDGTKRCILCLGVGNVPIWLASGEENNCIMYFGSHYRPSPFPD